MLTIAIIVAALGGFALGFWMSQTYWKRRGARAVLRSLTEELTQ